MSDLNPRQQRFVAEYLVDLNATQAAIRAGYSTKTAGAIGNENLQKPDIAAAIQVAMDARAERVGMTADQVLAELKAIGMSDVRHYQFTDHPSEPLVLSGDATDVAMRAVASVKRTVRRIQKRDEPAEDVETVEFKLWDKPAALRMAGQHLGMFIDRHEHSGPNGIPLPSQVTVKLVRSSDGG